ncbi:hypothetical protein GCM10027061_21760 [Nesterenkonia suensis]
MILVRRHLPAQNSPEPHIAGGLMPEEAPMGDTKEITVPEIADEDEPCTDGPPADEEEDQ